MRLRWSEDAANDLERITDYLFDRTPERAPQLVREIYEAPAALLTFPYRGRPGKRYGTREFVLPGLSCIAIYQITGDVIHITRILHGAQKWP